MDSLIKLNPDCFNLKKLKGNLDRIQKEAQVKELNSIFNKMTACVLIDYRGIEANQIVELRKGLKALHPQ
ncbi:MAG: hypothetical protein Ct9H300mP28_36760 [Pseudomonadota bacterium]|nr:MAG: hypothetical protein Ct9H300mP28_36760 [Pseudomonadota bacterium]